MAKNQKWKPNLTRMTVRVMGSAGRTPNEEVCVLVRRLGTATTRQRYILGTGDCPGMPHEAVKEAKKEEYCDKVRSCQ